ncbi:MAG: addiction module protein [Gemmatimonadota bacterium]
MVSPAVDFLALSVAERLQLVEDLWDSIANDTEAVPVAEADLREAEHRLAEHRRDPASAIPWDQVRGEIYKRGG